MIRFFLVGAALMGSLVTPSYATEYAYVPNGEAITVIDTTTAEIVDRIETGTSLLGAGIVIHPSGNPVYVSSQLAGTLMIDTRSHFVRTIPIPAPYDIEIDGGGNNLFLAGRDPGTVKIISTVSYELSSELAVGRNPRGIALDATGRRLYVPNSFAHTERDSCAFNHPLGCFLTVSVIDVFLHQVIATIEVTDQGFRNAGSELWDAAKDPNGARVFVAGALINLARPGEPGPGPATIFAIDTSTDQIAPLFQVAGIATFTKVEVNSDGSRLYAASPYSITAFDLMTNSQLGEVQVPGTLEVGVTADGATLLVPRWYNTGPDPGTPTATSKYEVSVVDTLSFRVVNTIELPYPPYFSGRFIGPAPALTPEGTRTPTASPTPVQPCVGDCSSDGAVHVEELVIAVRLRSANTPSAACASIDVDGNDRVSLAEIGAAIRNALAGCSLGFQ